MARVPREPATEQEIDYIRRLPHCSLVPSSWERKFAYKINQSLNKNPGLTAIQRENLYNLVYKYRKDLKLTKKQIAALPEHARNQPDRPYPLIQPEKDED
jgi:hypothetical protein